jgi:rhodanese-related sulfurtransferase
MIRWSRPLAAVTLAAVVIVSGCGGSSSSTGAVGSNGTDPVGSSSSLAAVREVTAAEAVEMLAARTVIDVRKPEEYAEGHVARAVNIDVEAADFDEQIADLAKDAPYLLYCRSGRRSAIAADLMTKAGFTDIVDAGGFAPLEAAGAPIE